MSQEKYQDCKLVFVRKSHMLYLSTCTQFAHKLNLVVQDTFEDVTTARNFVGVIKDLITFIRDFLKRLAEYKGFQEAVLKEDEEENLGKALIIAPYYPTRYFFVFILILYILL